MQFDFDSFIDRRATNSMKHDFCLERKGRNDLMPMWIADMDLKVAPCITEALMEVVQHGVHGYTEVKDDYFCALQSWWEQRHGWRMESEWLIKMPTVVFAIAMAIKAFTQKGDGVLIMKPVYYPFEAQIQANERKLINCALVYENGRYEIDWLEFERILASGEVKLFIHCTPQNPTGRVWTREEQVRIEQLCLKYNILVLVDEIHADFVYPGHKHIPFAALSDEVAQNCIVCTSPGKSFNIAGLFVCNILVPDPEKRALLQREVESAGTSHVCQMGLAACQAAHEKGGPWFDSLMEYICGNLQYAREFIAKRLPGIDLVEPEGTYLLWLDCNALGMNDAELDSFFLDEAKLWLDCGSIFCQASGQFQRLNMACPRATLQIALERLESALAARKN